MATRPDELWRVEQMVRDLGWNCVVEPREDDPPDVVLAGHGEKVAVEVRRVFPNETSKGSPDEARHGELRAFTVRLRDGYYADPDARPINVRIIFRPAPLKTPALRAFSQEEVRSDLKAAAEDALSQLRQLPALPRRETADLEIKFPTLGGHPIRFRVSSVPLGEGFDDLAKRWLCSPGAGWTSSASAALLQERVDGKAADLPRYRESFDHRILLLFSAEDGPGSFIDIDDGVQVDAAGFDAVFFQRALGSTRCIGGSLDWAPLAVTLPG